MSASSPSIRPAAAPMWTTSRCCPHTPIGPWGWALIDHVAAWALARDLPGVTLTTFADVPWTAPHCLRCGFHDLDDHVLGPELAGLLGAERTRYGPLHPRVAMVRPV